MNDKRFKKRDTVVKWKYIKDSITMDIHRGIISSHDKIPSYTDLIEKYSIDKNTAVKVYKSLERDNIIYLKNGLGYFVKPGAQQRIRDLYLNDLNEKLVDIINDARLIGMDDSDIITLIKKFIDD